MRQLALRTAALAAYAIVAGSAHGQLRIVDYNTAGLGDNSAMTTVFNAIRNEAVNGVVKPIDAIILQELGTGDIATVLNILNAQGVGTYAAGNVGSSTGAGGVGLVYRTDTLSLVAQQQVVNTSSSGAARGVMRYTLRPDGYDSSADFYIYGSHYKASDTGADRDRRNVEAAAIRANADALGDGAHIIYAGDFNIYRSSEPMWATLTGSGNGQAFDPVNQVGNWHDSASFKGVHTQNPAGSGGVGGGMDDRFDWQMVTGEMLDNEGLAMIPGSYHAFGNNGTHSLNGHINTGTGASAAVLNALGNASDHLPVVAQYQVPAKLGVEYPTNYQPRVIVGADVINTAVVRNAANEPLSASPLVAIPAGADELDYTASGFGAFSGSYTATDAAMGGWNTHSFQRDTATAGHKEGGITVTTTSPGVPIPNSTFISSYDVLDHANPSFSSTTVLNTLTYDFGSVPLGSASPTFNFSISNLLGTVGFTSDLEHDGFTTVGDTGIFTTGLETLQPAIEAGETSNFVASMSTLAGGSFESTFHFHFSDENLPGANQPYSLSLTLTGSVDDLAIGDFDNDGDNDGRDFLVWQRNPSVGDLADWQGNYGAGSVAAVAVPEPSLILLVSIVLASDFPVARLRKVEYGGRM